MTDNEIIKALEHCSNIVDSSCKECAYHDTYNASCVVALMCDVLDLINRQKAEIERLQKNEQIATAVIAESSAEIERAKKESDEWEKRFINRCRDYELEIQKNEKLKAKIAALSMKNADFDIENKAKDVFMDTVWPNLIKNAKTEAVREFSVAVQDAFAEYFKIDEIPVWYVTDKILGVEEAKIKELVGDENGKA